MTRTEPAPQEGAGDATADRRRGWQVDMCPALRASQYRVAVSRASVGEPGSPHLSIRRRQSKLVAMPRRKASKSDEPHEFVEHLLGLPAPTVSLPWTTYADMQDALGPAAKTSLADLAARDTLVVYFYPSEDEREGFAADTMSRVYRNNDGAVTQLGARTVGVSTETALNQQQIAASELFPQLLLSDEKAEVAKDLDLPTVIIDDRPEYEPLAIIIRDGKIAYVAYTYPGAAPSEYIEHILRWLAENQQTKSGARKGKAK